MEVISIQHLKRHLSSVLRAAASGTRFVVTRHKQPVAEIGASGATHVHVGSHSGKATLRPAIEGRVGRRYLEVLREDRAGGREADG